MMYVQFKKDWQIVDITTNNKKDIDYFQQNGYHPFSLQFVPGIERISPKSVDKRINITKEFLIDQVKNTRILGAAKLNAEVIIHNIKIIRRNDPSLLSWYTKFERFHKFLSEEELNEGILSLEQKTIKSWKDYDKGYS